MSENVTLQEIKALASTIADRLHDNGVFVAWSTMQAGDGFILKARFDHLKSGSEGLFIKLLPDTERVTSYMWRDTGKIRVQIGGYLARRKRTYRPKSWTAKQIDKLIATFIDEYKQAGATIAKYATEQNVRDAGAKIIQDAFGDRYITAKFDDIQVDISPKAGGISVTVETLIPIDGVDAQSLKTMIGLLKMSFPPFT